MARRGVLGLFAGGVAVLLAGCGDRNSLRYKMTVEVETPEGLRSGSAVRQVRLSGGGFMFGEGRKLWRLQQGEAVAVDLPSNQTLFALLSGGDGDADYAGQVPLRAGVNDSDGLIELWPNAPDTRGLKHTDPAPMLVKFNDIHDPKSVARVDPANLAVSFGAGVALKRITIEKTNEPVTIGIKKSLMTYGIEEGHGLDRTRGITTNPSLAQQLGYRDFIKGAQE